MKPKHVLLIGPEPSDLRIAPLLNQRGVAVDIAEASSRETLFRAMEQPGWWDLILCDAATFESLGVEASLRAVRDEVDSSLVLLKGQGSDLDHGQGHQLGAADLVAREDIDHLLMVCERELKNGALRKEIRDLRRSKSLPYEGAGNPVVLPTIHDMSRNARVHKAHGLDNRKRTDADGVPPADQGRIRSLIDAGGLTLEFQPIISLRSSEEHSRMFETLVRLKDDRGNVLMPGEFLPIAESAGWMSKIDIWIVRRALATLREMHESGERDAVLFINLSNETLRSADAAKAVGAFISASRLTAGSIVIEVRRSAFELALPGLQRLVGLLQAKSHGLLLEDARIDDCRFLAQHRNLITHIKLDRSITQGLVERKLSQASVNALVQCARKDAMRVIALAVDNAELLPMLFTAGVDAIQGHFISMPYQNLMYPGIQRIESSSGPSWQGGV